MQKLMKDRKFVVQGRITTSQLKTVLPNGTILSKMTRKITAKYYGASSKCDNNRATLPVPISAEENEDIAQLLPGKNIWLDITAYSNEFWWGSYWSTTAPSDIVTYSNWRNGEGGAVECENEINVLCEREKSFAFMSSSDGTNEWITAGELEKHYVVCIFRI